MYSFNPTMAESGPPRPLTPPSPTSSEILMEEMALQGIGTGSVGISATEARRIAAARLAAAAAAAPTKADDTTSDAAPTGLDEPSQATVEDVEDDDDDEEVDILSAVQLQEHR
ncbi:hypothetical protein COL5a_001031 [Colletotrichum fioriniae]|uniref:uncharacterized protein n=1 Tax=Colletotrichum fioriniae TaxID=710243 RepID=UPI0032D9F070|nr:hypothetical protein COL5a_001031 [Colletotrichum fioriniae]KAJ3941491.1 hypothetical protein N0V96_008201 [Colletotrichum fioriniae]